MTDRRVSAYAKGVMGEDAACRYLRDGGMEPLFRRFRSPFGEIDLVLLDRETLVFAEVKAREQMPAQDALLAVTPVKRQRLIETARCFVSAHPEHAHRVMRFDVVAVARDGVRHIPNAFEGAEW